MLIEFSVANFLSFKEKTTFSMLASHDKTLPQNVIRNAQGSGIDLLKSAVIYGANASGKSNFVKALGTMCRLAGLGLTSTADRMMWLYPFKLDEKSTSNPSEFDAEIIIDGIRYVYGFKIDNNLVHEEWLYSYPKSQKRELFHRIQESPDQKPIFKFSKTHFKGENKTIERVTAPNSLFLSRAFMLNHQTATQVHRWFFNNMTRFHANETAIDEYLDFSIITKYLKRQPKIKAKVEELLKSADIDIETFEIVNNAHYDENRFLDSLKGPFSIVTHRTLKDNRKSPKTVVFQFEEESMGTRKLLTMLCRYLEALTEGGLLVIDELDLRLHPNLARWLIELFHNEKYNKKDAQLIFTTHNTELMDKNIFKDQYDKINTGDLFRRDQIWFVEKDSKTSATSIYSHWDFKDIRENENKRVNYHIGRYGAIPFLEEID